jgi:hypothetical protein
MSDLEIKLWMNTDRRRDTGYLLLTKGAVESFLERSD